MSDSGAPLQASAPVPATADIAGIVRAVGGDPTRTRYDSVAGILTIFGVSQAALDAVTSQVDPLFARRFQLKAAAAAELARRTGEGLPWQNKVVQIDDMSTGRMTSVAFGMSQGAATHVAWRMADNTPLVLDQAAMLAMATLAMGYVLALRGRYWQIVDAANAAPDDVALDQIDPSADWPTPADITPAPVTP